MSTRIVLAHGTKTPFGAHLERIARIGTYFVLLVVLGILSAQIFRDEIKQAVREGCRPVVAKTVKVAPSTTLPKSDLTKQIEVMK